MSHGQPPGWNPPPGPGQPPQPQQGWAQPAQPQPGWAQPQPQQGWAQPAQPQQGWAPPAQPAPGAFGHVPAPGAFGQAPAPGAFGQAPASQGGFGQAPPQPAWPSSPGPTPPAQGGWQSPPGQGIGGSVGFGAAAAPPVKDVGFFDKIPCPHCGSPMTSSAGAGAMAGRMVGGLVGWLVVAALASEYHCPQHGQLQKSALPESHQSMVTMRKIAMLGSAGALLIVVFGCIMFSAVLQSVR